MTAFYIPSKNTIINDAHIIRAEFIPEHLSEEEIDEFSGKKIPARMIQDKLILYTTEIDLEESTGYDGSVRGAASKSQKFIVNGAEAHRLWDAMVNSSYAI